MRSRSCPRIPGEGLSVLHARKLHPVGPALRSRQEGHDMPHTVAQPMTRTTHHDEARRSSASVAHT